MRNRWVPFWLGALLLAAAGCGPSHGTIHGKVTANGKDVEEGFISFNPADDRNGTHGAPIANGKYEARLKPGKYWVFVSGGARSVVYPKSQADLKKMSDQDLELRDQVPAEATGNNQEVEIKAGRQEHDIALEYATQRP